MGNQVKKQEIFNRIRRKWYNMKWGQRTCWKDLGSRILNLEEENHQWLPGGPFLLNNRGTHITREAIGMRQLNHWGTLYNGDRTLHLVPKAERHCLYILNKASSKSGFHGQVTRIVLWRSEWISRLIIMNIGRKWTLIVFQNIWGKKTQNMWEGRMRERIKRKQGPFINSFRKGKSF